MHIATRIKGIQAFTGRWQDSPSLQATTSSSSSSSEQRSSESTNNDSEFVQTCAYPTRVACAVLSAHGGRRATSASPVPSAVVARCCWTRRSSLKMAYPGCVAEASRAANSRSTFFLRRDQPSGSPSRVSAHAKHSSVKAKPGTIHMALWRACWSVCSGRTQTSLAMP